MPSKRKAVAKSKQSPVPRARLSPFPSPLSCPVVSDDVQFKLQISNLKSLDVIHDALFENDFQQWYSCVSDNPIRDEHPRMTTNTTTVPLGMIPIPLR